MSSDVEAVAPHALEMVRDDVLAFERRVTVLVDVTPELQEAVVA